MRKPRYAWIVLAVTFACLLVSAATRATPSVLIVPLQNEFGWSRATISAAIALNILLYGLVGPFAAGLIERFGPRRVMSVALLLIGCGTLATTTLERVWQLFALWGVLVGLGVGVVAVVLGATIVQRWFHRHRGLALGLLTASAATGQLVFMPFLARLVVGDGWRVAVIAMAAATLAMAPLAWLAVRDRPEDVGETPLGLEADLGNAHPPGREASLGGETSLGRHPPLEREASPPARPAQPPASNPIAAAFAALREASTNRTFWILAGSFFICGASTNGLVGTHLVPACMDHGIPEVRAAGLLAVMGIFDLIGTTGSGWLSDRFDNRLLLCMYYGLRGVSLMFLPYAFDARSHGLSAFAVFYGLDWIATVPPTVALTRQAFGAQKTGLVFGWVMASHQIGAALAAAAAGYVRSAGGSYDPAFVVAGGLCLVAALGVLFAGSHKTGPASHPGKMLPVGH